MYIPCTLYYNTFLPFYIIHWLTQYLFLVISIGQGIVASAAFEYGPPIFRWGGIFIYVVGKELWSVGARRAAAVWGWKGWTRWKKWWGGGVTSHPLSWVRWWVAALVQLGWFLVSCLLLFVWKAIHWAYRGVVQVARTRIGPLVGRNARLRQPLAQLVGKVLGPLARDAWSLAAWAQAQKDDWEAWSADGVVPPLHPPPRTSMSRTPSEHPLRNRTTPPRSWELPSWQRVPSSTFRPRLPTRKVTSSRSPSYSVDASPWIATNKPVRSSQHGQLAKDFSCGCHIYL